MNIGIDLFILSAAGAVIIAVLTVSLQTIKASVSNPADSLRYE